MISEELTWRQPWANGHPAHSPIPPPAHPTYDLHQVVHSALAEDAGELGDITTMSTVPEDAQAQATFLAKEDGVLAGLAVADTVFEMVDPSLSVEWSGRDGQRVTSGTKFGTVHGSARAILIAERIALNFMQRMSGIATATAAMVAATEGHPAKVLCTRKTAPGLRVLDKWAVIIGGTTSHRMGLYDMIMIKDNHVSAAGGIKPAIQHAQSYVRSRGLKVPVEVEARTLEEVQEVLDVVARDKDCCVTRVMLDNMAKRDAGEESGVDVSMLRQAVELVDGRLETEASGNVTLQSVGAIAATGVTFISCGALTHSVRCLDISLKIRI